MPRTHLSYNEFGDLATAVGKQLAAVGVKAGDVALILNNSVEWAALSYGANGIGAAYTACTRTSTARNGPTSSTIQRLHSLLLLTPLCSTMVANMPGDASGWPSCGILLLGDEPANELPPGASPFTWADFVALAAKPRCSRSLTTRLRSTPDYTSGTTGNPKGVMLSNWNTLSTSVRAVRLHHLRGRQERCVLALGASFSPPLTCTDDSLRRAHQPDFGPHQDC